MRAVQGSKKDTSIRAIVSVVDSGGRVIKSLVAPGIVAGEHRIAAQHVALLRTIKGLLATDLAARNSHRYKPRGLSSPMNSVNSPISPSEGRTDGDRANFFDPQTRCNRA